MANQYHYQYMSGDDDESDWEPIIPRPSNEDLSYSSTSEDDDESTATSCQDHESFSAEEEPYSESSCSKIQPLEKSSARWSWKVLLALIAIVSLTAVAWTCKFTTSPTIDFGDARESIYVPGVGFSGFWFTLGRLKSIQDPSSKHFVCFSAGCLGAAAILNDYTVDEMACLAETAQQSWKSGAIGRYEVVSQFVDGLVYRNNTQCTAPSTTRRAAPIDQPHLLSKLHILTTTVTDTDGVKAAMRSPSNLDELRELLIQSAWIPLATGNGLLHKGHMDGGFSLWQHPKCDKYVTLPLDAGLILNSLNVNMGRDEAYRLWNDGLAYGL